MAGEKEIYKQQLIEYLANPENEPLVPGRWHEIVGLSGPGSIYWHFGPEERREIASEALIIRRQAYALQSFKIDQALVDAAGTGDIQAVKLFYQRLEGWSERVIQQHGGEITFVLADSRRPETKPPEITIGARTNEPEKV